MKGTHSMKKTVLVIALATVMVLAFASTAFATGGYDYIPWSAAAPNNVNPTPHMGYTTTTQKCAVCHSVHNAAVSGTTYNATLVPLYTGDTELLLRSSAADACTFCHITDGVSSAEVYGGVAANYTVDSEFAHNQAHAPCVDCHSVHGAGTYATGSIATKILKTGEEQGYESVDPADLAVPYLGTSLNHDEAVTAFCTNCHKYYSDASETTVTFTGWNGDTNAVAVQTRKHHPLKDAEGTFVAQGATYGGRVAWVNAPYCRSCHDAGDPGTDFPHYTAGAARFLLSASSSTAAAAGAASSHEDGACLKCHVNDGIPANGGVNSTF